MSNRREPPLRTKLRVALRQAGLDPDNVRLDHHPALELRLFDEATGLYDPDQHDERYLQFMPKEAHDVKTFGTHIPMSGDISVIAKTKRQERDSAEFRARILAKTPGKSSRPKSKWPKRRMHP
jgi:hypothetical protein